MLRMINNILSYFVVVPQQRVGENIIKRQPSFRTVKPDVRLDEKSWTRKFHVSSSYSRFDERIKEYNKSKTFLSSLIEF